MYKFLILFLMLVCGIFFIPETFAEAINYKPYQESMILLVDQQNQESHLTISLMSKSIEDFVISDQLNEKIKNTDGLLSISLTNKEECVIGVENETCILISSSRMHIANLEEYESVQEGAREIGNSFIDDLDDLFLTSVDAKFHSVFLHTGGAFLAAGDYGANVGVASAVYTLPKQSTEFLLQIMSASLLNKEIRSGEGFLDAAKKMSQNDNSVLTFTIIPEKQRVLYVLTTSLDIPIDQIDVYNLKPLDIINLDTVSSSEYFSDGFFPLNSVISVIVYPENDIEVKEINSPLIGDLTDIDMLKQGGWFTYSFQATADSTQDFASTSGQSVFRDSLDMKYFFGTESTVSKQQLEIRSTPIGEELPPARIGGCLIATAAFGSEMAPQVQFLRELRDNTVLQTESGASFMSGFNQFYYLFSPAIADYERENPLFKEVVKITLTPLLTSLTLLQYADIDSEPEMLGYGIGVILLNIGMYFVAPAVMIMKVRKNFCK